MDPQWMQNLTCEQRRAIEYGVDEAEVYYDPEDGITKYATEPEPDYAGPEALVQAQNAERMEVERQVREADPRPDGRDYACPVAFGCAYADWERRQR